MLIKKIILALVLSLSLFGLPAKGDTEPEVILTPKESIQFYALKYGANKDELLKVANCESRFDPNAIHYNDGGKNKHSVGIFQYQESTFNRMEKVMGEDLDYYSWSDQVRLTAYMFANHPEVKTEWTCYRITKKV